MKRKIISISKLVLFPFVLGVILYSVTSGEEFFEVPLVVFGLIELIISVRKFVRNDKRNVRQRGTYKSDKNSVEYKSYVYSQSILLISAGINFLLSYIGFLLLR